MENRTGMETDSADAFRKTNCRTGRKEFRRYIQTKFGVWVNTGYLATNKCLKDKAKHQQAWLYLSQYKVYMIRLIN